MLADAEPALNGDQAAAVRRVAGSAAGIDAITALAGSGKTTMIGALAGCYRAAGWEVIGAAPTGRAARQLRETAAIPAETMHSLLLRLARTGGFGPRTVLVLDEAGMAPTRLTARLFAEAERTGVKVVAVGDPGQLGSVQAGGWLAAITAQQAQPALRHAVRQQDEPERQALQALHDGDPDSYLAHKQDQITVYETETAAIMRLVEQWSTARQQHGAGGAVMIARDNYTRELANRRARAALIAAGALPAPGVVAGGREYARGDRVIARRNDHRHDIDNGTLATVVQVDARTGAMIVHTDAGEPRALDAAYVAEHLEHAYALTAHGAQGATVDWAAVIGRPQEFTREWAYTALSRARHQTSLHLIAEPPEQDREHEQYAPPAPERAASEAHEALRAAMRRTETERLAAEQVQPSPPRPEQTSISTTSNPPGPGDRSLRATINGERDQLPGEQAPGPETASNTGTDPDPPPPARPAHQPENPPRRLKHVQSLQRGLQQRRGPTLGL